MMPHQQPQQQPQQPLPAERRRKGPSPWLLGAAALGGGYLADRYGNGGKGMNWLQQQFQQAAVTAPKPIVPDAAVAAQQRSDASINSLNTAFDQLNPAASNGQRVSNAATMTAASTALSPTLNKAVGWASGKLPGRLGSTLTSVSNKVAPHLDKVAPAASKVLAVAAPISGGYNAANSDAFNGSTSSKALGAGLGAAQGAATAAAFMPAIVGSGPLAPVTAAVSIPTSMIVDSGLNAYRENVAYQAADQGAADTQMKLMKRYLTALRDPATNPAAMESAKRYFSPTMQQSLDDPRQQHRYGHNAWLWDKIKPMLNN